MTDEVWRVVAEAVNYEVSNLGNVRNATTRRLLNTSSGSVLLSHRSGVVRRGVKRLVNSTFDPTEVGERWETCKHAYKYSVSSLGRVRNNATGRILKPNKNGQVVMMDAGYRVCRTVSKLVKEAFKE